MSVSKYMYIKNPKHNYFDLSHSNGFTTKTGKVTPNLVQLALPGDRFHIECTSKTYTSPMITSPFQRINVSQRFFFVPLRELMPLGQFDELITGGKDLNTTVVRPTINSGNDGFAAGSLMDYLDYASNYMNDEGQTVVVANKTSSAWALRAYAKIINDYYINPDIEEELPLKLEGGLDTETNTELFDASWALDYFTENLPQSGRGSETLIPIGSQAPIKNLTDSYRQRVNLTDFSDNGTNYANAGFNSANVYNGSGSQVGYNYTSSNNRTVAPLNHQMGLYVPLNEMKADLSSVSGVNVDELFALFGIDAYKKLSMRVGSKINEFLLGIWGVQPRDLRLHRSLYLGGRVSPLIIEEVDQTSQTTQGESGSALATLAGRGVSVNSGSGINFTCDDYGVIIGLYCVMPQAKYFQGTPRWYEYEDYLDWPNPRLALLGDQQTMMSELLTLGDNEVITNSKGEQITNKTIIGFNPKYEELRGHQSGIHGQMKTTLKHYTLAREFDKSEPPLLNSSLLRGTPSKRIYSVIDPNEDELRVETGFKIDAWRKFPKYGNPAVMRLFS